MTLKTRSEMQEEYGSVPFAIPLDRPYTWTIHRAHATVSWMSIDGGETWTKKSITSARERVFACVPDESGGYDPSDPKHPDWHSVHADLHDRRSEK